MTTATETKIDHWQDLMDEAYARWQKGGDLQDLGFNGFAAALDPAHSFAVMCGKLNQQVYNGGFLQWIDNGYCLVINDLIEALKDVGPLSDKVIGILKDIAPYIDTDAECAGMCGEYLTNIETECGWCHWGTVDCGSCGGDGQEECPDCYGDGAVDGEDCETCCGTGEGQCGECEGSGESYCNECGGTGYVEPEIPIDLDSRDSSFYEIADEWHKEVLVEITKLEGGA